MDTAKVAEIVERHGREPGAVIGMLQEIQSEYRYVPRDLALELGKQLGFPESRMYALATFFKAFTLKPRGEHHICVCIGTACHVKGGQRILERLALELGIGLGNTTQDGKFSLEAVRCVGCCGLAPVVIVGDDVHGNVRQDRVARLLSRYGKGQPDSKEPAAKTAG